jgi:predicted deacylase
MSSASAGPEFPLQIEPPDISRWRAGNTGIDYAIRLDGARAGPRVLVTAVVHGNELCGAVVLDWLLRDGLRPRAGTLTLAFANVEAYHAFDPLDPAASRYVDEDFNRLWTEAVLDGPRHSAELRRARQLRPLVDEADALLDIHSMQQHCEPLMMCGPAAKGRELALALGSPVTVVVDAGHTAGRRMRDYAPFVDPASTRNALLIECGQHWQADSVDVARDVTVRFLDHFGMLDPDFVQAHRCDPSGPQRVVEVQGPVTIRTDHFRFVRDFRGMEVVPEAGTVIGYDGEEPVRTPFDDCVLIMPSLRRRKGESAVRLGRFASP